MIAFLSVVLLLLPLVIIPGQLDPSNLAQGVLASVVSWLLLAWFLISSAHARDAGSVRALDTPIGISLAWAACSVAWASNRLEAIRDLELWLAAGILYFVTSRLCFTAAQERLILRGMVGSTLLIAVVALAQSTMGLGVVPQASPPGGTLMNRNHAAEQLALAVPALAALFLSARTRLAALSLALACGGVLAAMVHAGSRSAWLGLLAAIGVVAAGGRAPELLRSRRPSVRLRYVAAGVFLGVLLALQPPSRRSPEGGAGAGPAGASSADPGAAVRLQLWRDAASWIASGSPFGVGIGNFSVLYPRFGTPGGAALADVAVQPEAVHDEYLQVGVELGLVGLVLLLWGVGAGIATWRRLLAAVPRGDALAIVTGVGGVAACWLLVAALGSPLRRPAPLVAVAVAAGLLAARAARPAPPCIGARRWRLAGVALALLFAVLTGVRGATAIRADRMAFTIRESAARGDWDDVVQEANRMATLGMEHPRASFLASVGRLRLGDAAGARRDLEALVRGYPYYLNAVGNLGMAYLAEGRPRRALSCFDRLLAARPGDRVALEGRARALAGLEGVQQDPVRRIASPTGGEDLTDGQCGRPAPS